MKKNWRSKLIILVAAVLLVACSGEKQAENADTYTCPMHPTVVSDHPGTCPVCGMDLVRKARAGEEVQMTAELSRLVRSPNELVIAGIATTKPVYKSMKVTVNATGIVTYDTRQLNEVSARVGGRLENVFVKYEFQPLQKGQKVAEIYSPDLLAAQRELIFLIQNDPDPSLVGAAKSKLLLLGATQKQVDDITRSREPIYKFPIYSSVSGYLISSDQQRPVAPAPATGGSPASMDPMGGTATTGTPLPAKEDNSIVRIGSYVAAGETLFRIVETNTLWVELNIAASQGALVKRNDTVTLDFGNGRTEEGHVDFVEPFFSDGEQFAKIRVYMKHDDLRIGQLVNATLTVSTSESLWLPKASVVDLGVDKVVFVKDHEVLKPKSVVVGVQSNNWIEIKQGLLSADEVANDAQYLVDSESFIRSTEPGARPGNDQRQSSQQQSNDNSLMLSETQVKLANITTQKITTQPVGQMIRVNGKVVADENRSETVSSRATGRIERLFVKEKGRIIKKGEALYELYSEELLTLQKEYLLAKEQYDNLGEKETRYKSFLKAAERKLLLYGMTDDQVQRLATSRTTDQRILFVSPSTGTISEIGVTEGQYVNEGKLLYKIEDVGHLWVEAELYPNEMNVVKSGTPITIQVSGFENTPIDATIDFITPEYKANMQIAVVRASISNPGLQFRPGMQAQIAFSHSSKKGLAVPTDAIIRDANGAHVYVQTDVNTFQPRMVKTGIEDFEQAEIIEGLSENEIVAVSGAYLIYSEFILKKGTDPMAGHHHH